MNALSQVTAAQLMGLRDGDESWRITEYVSSPAYKFIPATEVHAYQPVEYGRFCREILAPRKRLAPLDISNMTFAWCADEREDQARWQLRVWLRDSDARRTVHARLRVPGADRNSFFILPSNGIRYGDIPGNNAEKKAEWMRKNATFYEDIVRRPGDQTPAFAIVWDDARCMHSFWNEGTAVVPWSPDRPRYEGFPSSFRIFRLQHERAVRDHPERPAAGARGSPARDRWRWRRPPRFYPHLTASRRHYIRPPPPPQHAATALPYVAPVR